MTLETFGYLPPLTREELAAQISSLLTRELVPAIEHTALPSPRDHYWQLWKLPLFTARTAEDVLAEVDACAAAHPVDYVKIIGYNRRTQGQIAFVARTPGQA
jgi:ribulose-bisphosphate carboxylase small chain